jgi:hypothetical protein
MRTYPNITGLISCMFTAVLCVSCGRDAAVERPVKPPSAAETLTVFVTGNVLGELKPCGCFGGQLGGLSRRAAIFGRVPRDKRLIVDTGSFIEGRGEQALIKYEIVLQALKQLDYDVANLSEEDIETGKTVGLFEDIGSLFNVITYEQSSDVDIPAKFTRSMLLKGEPVEVAVAAFDAQARPLEQLARLFTTDSQSAAAQMNGRVGLDTHKVNLLILNYCDNTVIDFIARNVPEVDCIVRPTESDEPIATGNPNRKPFVFSVGRYGRYICGLQITESPAYKGEPRLKFFTVPLAQDLPQAPALVQLYKDYQQIVSERNLLERYQRFSLPGDLEYTGSGSCKACHDYEYEKWSQKAHAHAYATLEQVGSERDPECVICHVVGMEYESGFISEEKTGHLKNVGCENCHGPGSEHVRTGGVAGLTEPKSECIDCHTPEHSGGYAGNEGAFLQKIVHWREPSSSGTVK